MVDVWRARGLLAEAAASSSSSSLRSSSSSSLARRDAERYALVWESEALINLSDVVAAWVRTRRRRVRESFCFCFLFFFERKKKLTHIKTITFFQRNNNFFSNKTTTGVIKFALQHWLYAGAAAAAAGPLALVSVSQVIDSAWAMVKRVFSSFFGKSFK